MSVEFSMEAWMRGEIPLPERVAPSHLARQARQEDPENQPQAIRHVGIYRTRKGLQTFVCRKPEKAHPETIEIIKTIKSEVQNVEIQLFRKYLDQPIVRSYLGRVGDHYDGLKRHVALCLNFRESEQECDLLFFTSNPLWSPQSRPVTLEECHESGLPWNPYTYLAPCTRFFKEIAWTDRVLSQDTVEKLRREFFPV